MGRGPRQLYLNCSLLPRRGLLQRPRALVEGRHQRQHGLPQGCHLMGVRVLPATRLNQDRPWVHDVAMDQALQCRMVQLYMSDCFVQDQ